MAELRTIDDLAPAPYNPRKISKKAAKGLAKSLALFEDVSGIVWNRQTGHLVTGHQRVEQLQQLGAELVDDVLVVDGKRFPVRVVDWSESKEKAANVTANNYEIGGEFLPSLGDMLPELKLELGDENFAALQIDELAKSLRIDLDRDADEDEVPAPPKSPITKPGDVWTLGKHRVLCGDATVSEDVAKVLDGADPRLMVTDPPYGVEYDPEWRDSADLGIGERSRGRIVNDDRVDWRDAWSLFSGDVVYCWHASWHAGEVQASIEAVEFEIRYQIIWEKQHFALSRGHYNWQHEPCWYAVRKGSTAKWVGDMKQTTVWQIANNNAFGGQDEEKWGHGTQKPIECMAKPIRNHEGDVYDPFLGTGTTLIAAEQLDRICYGIEISPAYVDVCVKRWENFTGGKAIKKPA